MAGAAAEPVALWLDCDPGHDDAIAIIVAGEFSLEKQSLVSRRKQAQEQKTYLVTPAATDWKLGINASLGLASRKRFYSCGVAKSYY